MKPDIYILKFCGLFDFNKAQRKDLNTSSYFRRKEISSQNDSEAWNYIHDQYYPYFRRFLTNEKSEIDDFTILSSTETLPKRKYQLLNFDKTESKYSFEIDQAELFLFPTGTGIIAIDIRINLLNLSINDIPAFVNLSRNYNSTVEIPGSRVRMTMLSVIQDHFLNMPTSTNKFDLLSKSKIAEYRGSKFKVFQGIDSAELPNDPEQMNTLLFNLATASPVNDADQKDLTTHAEPYFNKIMVNAISVYKNWTALCLFDTFTLVGTNYLNTGQILKTWKENYFRIYIYDLYFKFYLFSVNGDGLQFNNRLKQQRKDFYKFVRLYDADRISYNFLPNLIHDSIREGLETRKETDALRERIERINNTINEDYNKLSNWILFGLAFITLIPSNYNDFYTTLTAKEQDERWIYQENIIIVIAKAAIIILIIFLNIYLSGWYKRWFRNAK